MDNLGNVYYLIQIILQQILIFLQGYIFREFTWFTPVEQDPDDTSSKIRMAAPHHAVTDIFVFLIVCGLLFAFMNLSTNSSKNQHSSYGRCNTETVSMTLEEDVSSFWYSKSVDSSLVNSFRACNDVIRSLNDAVPNVQTISHSVVSKERISPRPRISNYNARSSSPRHYRKMQANHAVNQTTPREWLIRRTRSGHVYGKYPM